MQFKTQYYLNFIAKQGTILVRKYTKSTVLVQHKEAILDFILYPSTVKILASEIIRACDAYKSREISTDALKEIIIHYANNYPEMLFDANRLNPTVLNRIGKKREIVVNKLLKNYQYSMLH